MSPDSAIEKNASNSCLELTDGGRPILKVKNLGDPAIFDGGNVDGVDPEGLAAIQRQPHESADGVAAGDAAHHGLVTRGDLFLRLAFQVGDQLAEPCGLRDQLVLASLSIGDWKLSARTFSRTAVLLVSALTVSALR